MIQRKVKTDIFAEAVQIAELLLKASDAYYNDADSIITDMEYDQKKDYLRDLYHTQLLPKKSVNSDAVKKVEKCLNQIGAPVQASEWKKYQHKIPMTSLNKVNSEPEFSKWESEIRDQYYLLLDKMDGGSIKLYYENGKLEHAVTRGDGSEGEDVVQNVSHMKYVKTSIPGFTGEIVGEMIIERDDFDEINRQSVREYKNPRNAATGISKQLDGTFTQYISIYHYNVVDYSKDFSTEDEKLLQLEAWGLKTCFWKKLTKQQVIALFNKYENEIRASLNYDIDGLVIRCDSIAKQEEHGSIGGNPKAVIAWKFKPIEKETIIESIKVSLGNCRRVTPVAYVQATAMGGVTVRHVTLHNYDIVKKMGLATGCRVLICRANDVIPFLLKNFTPKTPELPTHCPECGAGLEEKGKYIICPNDNCSGLGTGNLERWINVLDVESVGPKLIEVLYSKGMVKEPADFYKLTENQLADLDRMGDRSAQKIVKNLRAKMKITLPDFIAGLNIPNFSTSTAETMMEAGYDSITKMFSAQEHELSQIKGIGEKTAHQIVTGIQAKCMVIKNLFDVGVTIKEPEKVVLDSSKLSGKSFCFTGAINTIKQDGKRYTREDMHELVIKNSGKVEEGVKKGLTFLVMADPSSTSGKTQKAKDMGVELLSEADFFKMIK